MTVKHFSLNSLIIAVLVIYSNATHSAANKLNDTGIITCGDYAYDNATPAHNNDLTCTANATDAQGDPIPPGQDAAYGRDKNNNNSNNGHAGFVFTKVAANGSKLPRNAAEWSCVKDKVTGLIWETKTNDGGLHDKKWTYTWYETNPAISGGTPGTQNGGNCGANGACDTTGYVQAVNANGLCGANNWRMPTQKELQSIVHYGRFNPAIDINYFPNTVSTLYLTSSPYVGNAAQVWGITFSTGTGPSNNKSTPRPVRLVRGN